MVVVNTFMIAAMGVFASIALSGALQADGLRYTIALIGVVICAGMLVVVHLLTELIKQIGYVPRHVVQPKHDIQR